MTKKRHTIPATVLLSSTLFISGLGFSETNNVLAEGFDKAGSSNLQEKSFSLLENLEEANQLKLIDLISDKVLEETENDTPLTSEEKLELNKLITDQVKLIEEEKKALETEISILSTSTKVNLKYTSNLKTAKNIKAKYDGYVKSNGLTFANTYRLGIFYSLVKTGGAWDLKRELGKDTKYSFKGTQKTGEYIGNHHYGYMGKAIGFSNTVLKSAAGMYQVKSDTYEWKWILSYFDDPADQKAITDGYTDYNNGYRFPTLLA